NRQGDIVGLTCRVGRAVIGTVEVIRDVIEGGRSILLLGRPGVGKTTLLREAARVLADDLDKRVVVVDTSNEIAGDGDVPHPGIGRARRMQVPTPEEQHAVMIEAVENHMPQVIVIDEIGTHAEALAARTIAERGVQLVATAHGNSLDNLLLNPTLADLVGGIHAVTLSDEEARRRGTQKTVLERKAPPTFDVLIEIQEKDRLAVHHRVADVVDRVLRGTKPRPEVRVRTAEGMEIEEAGSVVASPPQQRAVDLGAGATNGEPPRALQRQTRIYPFAVSRGKLERAIRDLGVPARLVGHLHEADLVLTVKAQERRQPQRIRDAQASGVRLEVVRSNTVKQMEAFLRKEFGLADFPEGSEVALQEVEDAVDSVLEVGRPVELSPQDSYVRRLQHELVERAGLVSESKGREPYRRLVIYPN
ncbi:MAG TPA: R3H domain-containing nucleic acid-binding protein, partial [Thermoanaerobaculia bacterium]|nr:R3H domain-containing nucleic acid-binding protein [Thermoanaerobaculia bacterium]